MSSPPQFYYPLCLLPEDYGYPVYVRQAAGDVRVDGFVADAWPLGTPYLADNEQKALTALGLMAKDGTWTPPAEQYGAYPTPEQKATAIPSPACVVEPPSLQSP